MQVEWDVDPLEDSLDRATVACPWRDREVEPFSTVDSWYANCPRLVQDAITPRGSDTLYEGSYSYGTLRSVEGAPTPLCLLFNALNQLYFGAEAGTNAAPEEAPTVAYARQLESSRQTMPAMRPRRSTGRFCPICDFQYTTSPGDLRKHAHRHMRRTAGIDVPDSLREERGTMIDFETPWHHPSFLSFAYVSCIDRVRHQQIAYELSGFLQHEEHYDFNLCSAAIARADTHPDHVRHRQHAIIAIVDERAMGVLLLRRSRQTHIFDGAALTEASGPEGWMIAGVCVLPPYRRQGVAIALARHAARRLHIAPDAFLHNPPFSSSGQRFAERLSGTTQLRVAQALPDSEI